jgi:predicted TIM-barrel enzyme
MSPPNNREEILASLRKSVDNGQIIVGAGAGIGLSAKFIEQGGGDLIIIYNSGRYRMAGRGSLAGLMPYGNANDVVLEMVKIHNRPTSRPSIDRGIGWRSSANCTEDTSTSWSMRD